VRSTLIQFMLGLALAWCCSSELAAAPVVIVASERSPAYTEASEALVGELERGGLARSEVVQLLASELGTLEWAGAAAPRAFITLGAEALQRLLARDPRAPAVAALIPRSSFERALKEYDRKLAGPLVALYLDQPWGRQLDLVRLALPDARKVGVLWGPDSVARKAGLAAAAQERGMELVGGVVTGGALFNELKLALDGSDVFLAVPDPQVFNSGTISNLLLATYRARIPMAAFSPAYVKAGALLSLHSTPGQIGVQAAGMLKALLQGGTSASQYPWEFTVTVNEHVAQSLGLQLNASSLAERLRKLERKP